MALTVEGTALTEAHRLAQARLGAETIVLTRTAWGLLDLGDLDGSSEVWVSVTEALVQRQAAKSAQLAGTYYQRFRSLEATDPPPFTVTSLTPDEGAVRTSLLVQGPVGIKTRIAKGALVESAAATAEAETTGAAMRHALNAGRETLYGAIGSDRVALGWLRVTSASPCWFCAMLASRGPVYKGESFSESDARFTGAGGVKVHDSCMCTVEPVMSRKTRWPAPSTRFAAMWSEAKRDAIGTGRTAAQVFRSMHESALVAAR